jgi:hypothetical protein
MPLVSVGLGKGAIVLCLIWGGAVDCLSASGLPAQQTRCIGSYLSLLAKV